MTASTRRSSQRNGSNPRVLPILAACVVTGLGGCAGIIPVDVAGASGPPSAQAAPKPPDLGVYFDALDRMAPGDPVRQASEVAALLAEAQRNPTASNRLRYALALGAAGHTTSNPVEARRLISELLAGEHDLQPREVSLANACLREFDARVALYADLARQREEAERKLQAFDADGDRRYNALNAETQRLKKALAEAERKLEAVAEMEQALTPDSPNP